MMMMISMRRGGSTSFFSVGTLPYDMEWSQSKITLTNEVEKEAGKTLYEYYIIITHYTLFCVEIKDNGLVSNNKSTHT